MIIYFGIGSNIGDREANLRRAIELLHERVGECMACSSIYRTAPQGFVSENEFANMVAVCETCHSPEEVLIITQQIEREMGRAHKSINGNYTDRIIDIDILLYGDERLNEPDLIIPHPLMWQRSFVYEPLWEIAPHLKP